MHATHARSARARHARTARTVRTQARIARLRGHTERVYGTHAQTDRLTDSRSYIPDPSALSSIIFKKNAISII